MASQTQYYQAKVFLKAYGQALQTLDDVHKSNNHLAKNMAYKDLIVNGNNKGQISIRNGNVVKQRNFENSRIRNLGIFSAKNFAKDLTRFETIQSFNQLTQMLQEKTQ